MSLTASAALSPLACTWISTSGTDICGSSSRGRTIAASVPRIRAANSINGVSGELMKACVSFPDIPSFIVSPTGLILIRV